MNIFVKGDIMNEENEFKVLSKMNLTKHIAHQMKNYFTNVIKIISPTYTFFYKNININNDKNKICFMTYDNGTYTVYVVLPKEYIFLFLDYMEYIEIQLRKIEYEKKYSCD